MARSTTTRRPVRQFTVTRVLTVNVQTGETFSVPGMVVTLAELRTMVADREISGTVQVFCDDCGESVVDCPDTRNSVPEVTAWSWRSAGEFDGSRHVDGLVVLGSI